eukprot:GFUD01119652.1.p1 GENE.GFUD01119652.1~~GFUD01119652.1.p1  ORF type:complete len:175 (+),score=45.84 GFUD01119652.1:7-531(+)
MTYLGCRMCNENDDEIIEPATDVFEINEFTAATDWEMFWLAEIRIYQSLSLRKKFVYDLAALSVSDQERPDAVREMERFVSSLGSGVEVRVLGAARGPAGRLIQNMFRENQQEEFPREEGLPPPSTKQFIRSLAPRPFPFSRPVPQRMYAMLGQGEFRVAGCFTVDRHYSLAGL